MLVEQNSFPAWAIADYLTVQNSRLHIDNVDAAALTEQFGTPLYVFSERRIRHNIARLKAAETGVGLPLKVCYAAKANSNMGVLRAVKNAGADLEVNSGGELFKALRVGFDPSQIIFNGTSKTERELREAIAAGIYAIQCDSLFELELIARVADDLQKRANVSLRIVPDIATKTLHGLQTAKSTSKFGMMPAEALSAFQNFGHNARVNLCGMHIHLGSQTPDATPFGLALTTLFEFLQKIYADFNHKLSHLNIGGGFPVNYLRDDSAAGSMIREQRELFAADLEPATVLGAEMQKLKTLARQSNSDFLLDNLTILIEPGRSVIADAGTILTTVCNHKSRPNAEDVDEWLLTDAGFNLMLSMETYKWYYHLISANRAGELSLSKYKIAGPLCDGGDVYFDIENAGRLPDYRHLPAAIQPGEVLALLNTGAYSLAQMFPYNARPLPAAVLINQSGAVELVRKPDTYETLIESDLW